LCRRPALWIKIKTNLARPFEKPAAILRQFFAIRRALISPAIRQGARTIQIAGWVTAIAAVVVVFVKTGGFEYAELSNAKGEELGLVKNLFKSLPLMHRIDDATVATMVEFLKSGITSTLWSVMRDMWMQIGESLLNLSTLFKAEEAELVSIGNQIVLVQKAVLFVINNPGELQGLAFIKSVTEHIPAGLLLIVAGTGLAKLFKSKPPKVECNFSFGG
jgi:hypothetical protein